jgi:hypothetical protein
MFLVLSLVSADDGNVSSVASEDKMTFRMLAIVVVFGVSLLSAGCAGLSRDPDDDDDDRGEGEGEDCPVGSEGCECTGGGSCDDALQCVDSTCTAADQNHLVFVTSAVYAGRFWIEAENILDTFATDEADARCNTLAQGAGLDGDFAAWLSSFGDAGVSERDGERAPERIQDTGPWYLVSGDDIVFNNKAALSGVPLIPLNVDENGNTVSSGQVWTGTTSSGQIGDDCESWLENNSTAEGTVGQIGATTSAWTDQGTLNCLDGRAHLYCFQQ